MASLDTLKGLAYEELVQLTEEGAQTEELKRALDLACEECSDVQGALEIFWREADVLRAAITGPYVEPSTLEEIQAARSDGPRDLGVSFDDTLRDRVLGAWLGRCSGCMLGKPVEGWRRAAEDRRCLSAERLFPAGGEPAGGPEMAPELQPVPEGQHHPLSARRRYGLHDPGAAHPGGVRAGLRSSRGRQFMADAASISQDLHRGTGGLSQLRQ